MHRYDLLLTSLGSYRSLCSYRSFSSGLSGLQRFTAVINVLICDVGTAFENHGSA
jgi:hypothetical protein